MGKATYMYMCTWFWWFKWNILSSFHMIPWWTPTYSQDEKDSSFFSQLSCSLEFYLFIFYYFWFSQSKISLFNHRNWSLPMYSRKWSTNLTLVQTSASLKFTVLNPKGRIWTMVAGGGASVIYADTVSAPLYLTPTHYWHLFHPWLKNEAFLHLLLELGRILPV